VPEVTDLPAARLGKERGHDLVGTGKVTAAVVGVEVVSEEETRVELPESTVPSSVVDEVVLAAEAVASEAPPVLLRSRVLY